MKSRYVLRGVASAVVGAALILVPAGSATAGEKNWRMRVVGALVGGDSGVVVTSGDHFGTGVAVNGGGGVGVNFEYRFSPQMGFEMGAMALGTGVDVGVGKNVRYHQVGVEVASFVPLTFGLNFHPLKKTQGFDLFVGPLIASTIYSRVGVGGPGGYGANIEGGVDFGLGVNLGADINLGKSRWSLNTGFKYISILTNSGDRNSRLSFDPLIFSFGFGFRF